VWLPGAFELGAAASVAAESGRYAAIVALGAVIRGETAHFHYVAGEAARGLNEVAVRTGIPVGFGVLTTDDLEQALARAGGAAGNKGHEAAEAALTAADVLAQIRASRGLERRPRRGPRAADALRVGADRQPAHAETATRLARLTGPDPRVCRAGSAR
jgi:6,7-dimethyl-8-ribityllumazine synthase